MKATPLLLACALLVACGSDGASDPGTGSAPFAGTWVATFSAESITGGECRFPSATLITHQDGGAITGSYAGAGKGLCVADTSRYVAQLGQGNVTGAISGTSATIDLSGADLHIASALHRDTLSGTVTWALENATTLAPISASASVAMVRLPGSLTARLHFIDVTPTLITLHPGDSIKPSVVVRDRTGQLVLPPPSVTLTSSDTLLATISHAGWIRATQQVGLLKLTASSGGYSSQTVVEVTPAH